MRLVRKRLGRRSGPQQTSLLEDQRAIREARATLPLVRGHEDGRALRPQSIDDTVDEIEAWRIERSVRLVEEHYARSLKQDASERKPLAHPCREGGDHVVRARREADLLEQRSEWLTPTPEVIGDDLKILLSGERIVEVILMAENRRQLSHVLSLADDVETTHPCRPAIGPHGGSKDPEECRLAGSVPAGHHDDRSGRDRKRHFRERPAPAVASRQPLDFDCVSHVRLSLAWGGRIRKCCVTGAGRLNRRQQQFPPARGSHLYGLLVMMRRMRKLASIALTFLAGCVASPPPAPTVDPVTGLYGMTVEEEAQILALEDRRLFDVATVTEWLAHPNALHRQRMALALARIGPHDFIDQNGDGDFDPPHESRVGVQELTALSNDPDRKVRETVAFALGEIGDPNGGSTLLAMAQDPDGLIASEAVEALSKLAASASWSEAHQQRYIWMTGDPWPEGVRARALRFLFRFNTDAASEAAMKALASPAPMLRQEAAYTLARRAYAPARPQLELLLSDPNVLTRAYAASALGRIADAASKDALVKALGDIHPWVRTNAATALAKVLEPETRNKQLELTQEKDLPRILAAARDADPGVRAAMIEVVALYARRHTLASRQLYATVANGSRAERELASGSVMLYFSPKRLDRWVLEPTVGGLVRALEASADHPDYRKEFYAHESATVRAAAIAAIPETMAVSETAVLLSALDDPDVIVRANAIEKVVDATPAPVPADKPEAPTPRSATVPKPTGLPAIPPAAGMPDSPSRTQSEVTPPSAIMTPQERREAIARWEEELKRREALRVERVARLHEIERQERTSELNDARLAAIRGIVDLNNKPEQRQYLRSLLTDADPVVRRLAADLMVEKTGADRPKYVPLPVTRTQAEYEEIVRWSRQPHTATIHMPRGNIELALLAQDAPMTTWNFAQLARRKFFDNTSFMRVVPNFVIQGGDPRNDQNGGPGYAIRDEINLQKYTRGAVGMALSGPDTGGSQFFIAHSPQPHLDGGYTIFARVYEGMISVVDQVERGDLVSTITIDEKPPVGAQQISSVPNVSLPLFIGPVTTEQLLQAVPEYAEKMNDYQPDQSVLEMMKSYAKTGDRIEVFLGTWCDDSLREVPKFLRVSRELLETHDLSIPVQLVAVDRDKKLPVAELRRKALEKVPTFIYYRNKRELGRITEQPASLIEDDLLAIVAKN
jgi:cyclophilin family peptidyl-prolyl cis-trans isomerase/HEAT repeat protein